MPRVALPLNGVYVEAHSAASATMKNNPEGALFAAVRGVAGAGVPVVATLDLHANVSRRMVAGTDLGISTEPNPLLRGSRMRSRSALIKTLPIAQAERTRRSVGRNPARVLVQR